MSTETANRRNPNTRAKKPVLEGLEDRLLLYATSGGQWVYPQRITYSFIPDNTSVGGVPSTLFRTLNAVAPTATWQQQIQKAAAIWETVAHVDLVQVSDDGAAIGSSGNQQGDARFGDIRIGAIPEQSGQLAFTFLPPPLNGGTYAGDIFFSNAINWQINTGYDLETVAIHELGHALGMSHSQIAQADMYAFYNGIKQSLYSDDVSGIQSLYGPIPADSVNNGQLSTATNITGLIDGNGQIALSGAAEEIAGSTDQDFFVVTVPSSTTGQMTVSMQTANLSSLAPRVTVYDSSGRGLAQAMNANGFGTTATLTISNVAPGQTYYIRAIAANTGPGSVGTYGLLVNFGSSPQAPIPGLTTVVASKADQGGGSSSDTTRWGALTSVRGGSGSDGLPDSGGVIHYGGLSGQGDALMASTRSIARHRHHHFAAAVQPHSHSHHAAVARVHHHAHATRNHH